MGLIRKAIAGTAAAATGGLSLGVVQYRSDTERGARQTKLLRQELQRQNAQELALLEAQQAELEARRLAQSNNNPSHERPKRLSHLSVDHSTRRPHQRWKPPGRRLSRLASMTSHGWQRCGMAVSCRVRSSTDRRHSSSSR